LQFFQADAEVEATFKTNGWNFQYWNGYEFGYISIVNHEDTFSSKKNIEKFGLKLFLLIQKQTKKRQIIRALWNFANQPLSLLSHYILTESSPLQEWR
jgi:hypothetical protein